MESTEPGEEVFTAEGAEQRKQIRITLHESAIAMRRDRLELEGEADTSDELRAKNAELWKGVFVEDIGVVEGMQAGRGAPGFDGGRFSAAMDGPTHLFHRWVAGRLQGTIPAEGQ